MRPFPCRLFLLKMLATFRDTSLFVNGLGWVDRMMDWDGMGYEKWTHGHVSSDRQQMTTLR